MSLKQFKKITKWLLFSLLVLILTAGILVESEWGQNFLINQITNRLSRNLHTKIQIRHVRFSLFNKMNLEGILIEDQRNDTLLYAEKLSVRMTDWFFMKPKTELKYIGLEHALVKASRTDSVWNYQFISDYFSGGSSSGGKERIAVDLKKLELRHISFLINDGWRGEDIAVQLTALNLEADEINFSAKKALIRSLVFSKPFFHLRQYTGLKPVRSMPAANETDSEKITDSLPATMIPEKDLPGWLVHIDQLKISEGRFLNEKTATTPLAAYFDDRRIDFTDIGAHIQHIHFYHDTLTAALQLQTKERSGLEVKSFMAQARVTPRGMNFTNLEIRTNKSIIRDAFSMNYETINDLGNFISRVKLTADFKDAEIDSDDIAFFAPALGDWKKKIIVSGKVRGTVDDLFGDNLSINAGRNTLLKGDISLTGLPDISRTFIDFKADNFQTSYADAVVFLPQLKSVTNPPVKNISYLHFAGNFTGFIRDFVTYGTIRTNLGTITSDLNMKLPAGKEPFYSGSIASTDFNLGAFWGEQDLGTISFSGQLKGRGFNWTTLSADLDMDIQKLVYKNYPYENILAKGSLNQKIFNGVFQINDSNVSAGLTGLVDINGQVPRFNFKADVQSINFQKLHILKDNYSLKGKLDFDFAGKTLDDFLGHARLTQAQLTRDGKTIPLDSFVISSGFIDGKKELSIYSNELDATISGQFSINDLPDAFTLFLNKYYPAYIRRPGVDLPIQDFEFEISTRYPDEFVHLFDSSFQGFNNSHIRGRLNTVNNQMELYTDVPSFSYKQYQFQNILLTGKGDLNKMELTGTIDQVVVSDSLSFPGTRIDLVAQNDVSDIRILTRSSNKNLSEGSIRAQVTTFEDGIALQFDSSSFIVNGKPWVIEKGGELEIRSGHVAHGQVLLKESNQEVRFSTQPSDIGNWNDLKIELKKFNIGDVTQFFVKSNTIEGLVSGSITIEDPFKKFNVVSDIQTDQLRLDNDSIGQLKAMVFYENKTGKLRVEGQNLNPVEKLKLDMQLFLKDLPNQEEDVITITPENYPIKLVERFIGTLFTDLQGYATGQLKITGKGNKRKYTGTARLHNAGLKVIFTQCFYKIMDTEIVFREDALDLGRMKLIDTVTHHTATLTKGIIHHDSWQNMQYDIYAEVDNAPILLLNTTARDNQQFYGVAKGTGSFFLSGTESNLLMKINAVASATDSSYITIPNTSSRETGIADFLIERKYGREMTDTTRYAGQTNLIYDVDVTGNPMVNVRVVLDDLTNDEIRGRGEGRLKIIAGTTEPLSIRGRYTINEGNYRFTFQSFFKKPFELKKDAGNYIEWTGDPYHPTVKIEAIYKTEKKVDFSPLISGITSSSTLSGLNDYVYVIARLSGDLFNPDIAFSLDFPPESPPKKDVSVSFVMDQLQNNENELNKQVAFLVVFNSFAPSDVGSTQNLSSAGVDLVVNSISGFLSSQINNVLNNILSNKLKIPGLYVNFSGALYIPKPFSDRGSEIGYDRTNLNLSIGKVLFNNRVVLTLEGSYDVPFQQSVTTTQIKSDLLTNFTTEFLINKSGTIRATIFYKENVDILNGTTTAGNNKSRRYGGSLAYRKEFNRLSEFLGRKKIKPVIPKPEAKKEE